MHWKSPHEIVAEPGATSSAEDYLRALVDRVGALVDILSPGTRGIHGAQEIPGVRIWAQTVGTTATLIPGNQKRKRLTIHNHVGGVQVFVIDETDKTTADGFPVDFGGTIDLECRDNVWLLVASGSATVRVIEEAS